MQKKLLLFFLQTMLMQNLLYAGDDQRFHDNSLSLLRAVKEGNVDEVRNIIGSGADVNTKIIDNGYLESPLHLAINEYAKRASSSSKKENLYNICTYLVDQGADYTTPQYENNGSLLHDITYYHNILPIFTYLLDLPKVDLNVKDSWNNTVLDRLGNKVICLMLNWEDASYHLHIRGLLYDRGAPSKYER